MGMFDSVVVPCKSCGNELDFQSKAGDCTCNTYFISCVPVIIAQDIDGDMLKCDSCQCETTISLSSFIPETVSMRVT